MKMSNKNKGITLVALVITIIVMLILAGVTISMLFGENGLIGRAQNATTKWNEATQNEQGDLNSLEGIIDNATSGGSGIKPGDTANGNQEYTDKNGNKATIPDGFHVSEKTSEQTIDNGLVIIDTEGNEFVWIPVDGTNVTYAKWISSDYNDYLSDDSLPLTVTGSWGQTETSQITKYKGFYISRYEAGIPDTLPTAQTTVSSTERNKSGYVPASKKNKVPWTCIDYTYSKTNAELMYNNEYVQSGLITGTMWDATMKWLENSGYNVQTDSDAWGNYATTEVTGITIYSQNGGQDWETILSTTKEISIRWLLKTGNTDYTKANNIYDLAGNVREWTTDLYSGNAPNLGSIVRGRCFRRRSAMGARQLKAGHIVYTTLTST